MEVTEEGLVVDIGYKKVPLDYIEDEGIAEKWANIRQFGTTYSGVWRPDSVLRDNPDGTALKAFFYDNSRWKIENGILVKTQDGIPAAKDIVDSVESVAKNDLSVYSNGLIRNGLIKESESELRPTSRQSGWILYVVGVHNSGIIRSDDGVERSGDITRAFLILNPNQSFTRAPVSYDTFESLAGGRDGGYRPIEDSGNPNQEVSRASVTVEAANAVYRPTP